MDTDFSSYIWTPEEPWSLSAGISVKMTPWSPCEGAKLFCANEFQRLQGEVRPKTAIEIKQGLWKMFLSKGLLFIKFVLN